MLATISHILFDLDGLLIDTETCYTIAFNNVTKKYGKEFPWELKTKCMGLTPDKTNELIIDELDLPISVEQLGREAEQQVSIEIPNAKLMPGAHRLVKHFYEHNIPMAIATGSDRKGFDLKISKHKDFFDKYFAHCVLAGDDPNVKRGKPFPDVFIEAMKKFGSDISPENVLVFEDSPLGIEAALAAGMACVWVPDERMDTSKLKATQVIKSLDEFQPQLYGLPPFHS